MCGRYSLYGTWTQLRESMVWTFEDRPDVRPSEIVPVLAQDGPAAMQWWFVPAHAPDPAQFRKTYTTFNARVETVTGSRLFGNAWRAGRRCALPMRGWYEWEPIEGSKKKQRQFLKPADGGMLWAAGLWERWMRADTELTSCTMLIGPALPDIAHIHARMPLFVPETLLADWLRAPPDEAMALALAAPAPQVVARAVDGPALD